MICINRIDYSVGYVLIFWKFYDCYCCKIGMNYIVFLFCLF